MAPVLEWVEIIWNRERLHGAIGYESLVDF
jgi:hypothetical protein